MFPSPNNENPIEFLFRKSSSLCDDQNPISKQDDHYNPFFLNIPSPFLDEHEIVPLNQILSDQNQIEINNTTVSSNKETLAVGNFSKLNEKSSKRRNLGAIPRKRTGKKDRHSKIRTAQGIRDRRMRLSLQVARKFFDLQDMLGYDKASKTIEWLFSNSNKAIKKLIEDNPQVNKNISIIQSKSDSKIVSRIEENNSKFKFKDCFERPPCIEKSFEKDESKSRKTASKPYMRESRDKARARARCRTREKMMMKKLEILSQQCESNPNHQITDQELLKLVADPHSSFLTESSSNYIPFESVDHQESSSINQEIRVSPYGTDYFSLEQHFRDEGTIEKLLKGSSSSSATVSDNISASNNFLGFVGNLDMLNHERHNSIQFAVTNQDSMAGNPNSIYSDTANFPLFYQ
ncbi:hypothetical protein ACJIZ3_020092 [Penstemon smallii]|uniref:Uncharacterized protein n=1 Tax=Penstemon smallii TaxID=265156 RepID=A0ABD3SHT9_9LAMI